jgi:hypothetical protein
MEGGEAVTAQEQNSGCFNELLTGSRSERHRFWLLKFDVGAVVLVFDRTLWFQRSPPKGQQDMQFGKYARKSAPTSL